MQVYFHPQYFDSFQTGVVSYENVNLTGILIKLVEAKLMHLFDLQKHVTGAQSL